jgi:hypothetical protein
MVIPSVKHKGLLLALEFNNQVPCQGKMSGKMQKGRNEMKSHQSDHLSVWIHFRNIGTQLHHHLWSCPSPTEMKLLLTVIVHWLIQWHLLMVMRKAIEKYGQSQAAEILLGHSNTHHWLTSSCLYVPWLGNDYDVEGHMWRLSGHNGRNLGWIGRCVWSRIPHLWAIWHYEIP